jgi:hypothetical protein
MSIKLPEAVTVAAIAAVAGLVSALMTAAYTHNSRNRELDIELVKIGIGILRADPKETQTRGAREWAVEIIELHSGRPFSAEAKRELLDNRLGFKGGYYEDFTYDPNLRPEPEPRKGSQER